MIVSCPDRLGIGAGVSSFLARHGGWIIEASQHADALAGWFFMRYEILVESLTYLFLKHLVVLKTIIKINGH